MQRPASMKNRNGFYVHSDCLLAALQLLDKSKKTTEKEKRKSRSYNVNVALLSLL